MAVSGLRGRKVLVGMFLPTRGCGMGSLAGQRLATPTKGRVPRSGCGKRLVCKTMVWAQD